MLGETARRPLGGRKIELEEIEGESLTFCLLTTWVFVFLIFYRAQSKVNVHF